MKKWILILLLLAITGVTLISKPRSSNKKGIIGRVKDAAAYGFGWQLGKEGAKEAIEKGKEVMKSPKTKENLRKAKTKVKEQIDNLKK